MTPPKSALDCDLFVTPAELIVNDALPPGEQLRYWPPVSVTLITGASDAVLVDPLMTIAQTRALNWGGLWSAARASARAA